MRKNRIGKKYEMYWASAERDRMALKAVVDPILIRASRQLRTTSKPSALIGTLRVGWT
jgi:hypothetical protein